MRGFLLVIIMRIWVAALLIFFCSSAYAVDLPASWPRSVDDVDWEIDLPRIVIMWEQSTGRKYCFAMNITNTAGFTYIPRVESETFTQYMERNKNKLIVRQLDEQEAQMCLAMIQRNSEIWLVEPWRGSTTRAVYEITTNFPSVKNKIGEIAVGEHCGSKVADYSATIKVFEWRKVTIPEGEGTTVCRKQ